MSNGWFDLPLADVTPTPPTPGSGITLIDVQNRLDRTGYPCILTSVDVQGAIDKALVELAAFTPSTRFATFPSALEVQDYYPFNPSSPSYVAGMATALTIENVWHNPGSYNDIDIFDPYVWMLQDRLDFRGPDQGAFDYPSQVVMFRQRLEDFRKSFGDQGYDFYGQPGAPDAFIRLRSAVNGVGQVVVEYTRGIALEDIVGLNLGWGRRFMQWVEHFAAEIATGRLGETAGTDIAGVKISDAAMRQWDKKATRLRDIALGTQSGAYAGCAGRS